MEKRLYRSRKVRFLSGVAGGLADYFDLDVSLVRLLIVLGTVFTGVFPGLLLYLIASIIIPEEYSSHSNDAWMGQENGAAQSERYDDNTEVFTSNGDSHHSSTKGAMVFGGFLVVVGGLLLLNRIFPRFFNWHFFWPLVLIFLGVAIIAGSFNRK